MLGRRFTVVDMSDNLRMYVRNLVSLNGFADRCASVRNIELQLARTGRSNPIDICQEKPRL